MNDNTCTLILSGHVCRPQSCDLRPFWLGFIALQSRLPKATIVKNIIAHSWNPKFIDLVDMVYKPEKVIHEEQGNFHPEFIYQVQPANLFEAGLDRENSTWRSVSFQSILGNLKSRAKAVSLLSELKEKTSQVLITRWDLGQTGSASVNTLVMDSSLPNEYLYLSYYPEIDEGYADMWILAPWKSAMLFSDLDKFAIESLQQKNNYMIDFCERGWPKAKNKTCFDKIRTHPIGIKITTKLNDFLNKMNRLLSGNNFFIRILRKPFAMLSNIIQRPIITAENSCVLKNEKVIFPTYLALNIHALLKYFILKKGLRNKTRFIEKDDFAKTDAIGKLIQPQRFILFLWNSKDNDIEKLKELFLMTNLPIENIYLLDKNERLHFEEGVIKKELIHNQVLSEIDALKIAILDVKNDKNIPILLLPSVSTFSRCQNWFYINALLKYMVWSKKEYIALSVNNAGKPFLEFPGVTLNRGDGTFSLQQAILTAEKFLHYLVKDNLSIAEFEKEVEAMRLEFPGVQKKEGLFGDA